MSIIRNEVRENYSVVTNNVLRSKDLSWCAKGIYSYLCGCSDGFDITLETIATFGNCGRHMAASGVKELKDAGLLETVQENDGRFGANTWVVKNPASVVEISVSGKPDNGKSDVGKTATNNTKGNNTKINNTKEADVDDKTLADAERAIENLNTPSRQKRITSKTWDTKEPEEIEALQQLVAIFKFPGNKRQCKATWRLIQSLYGISDDKLVAAATAYVKENQTHQMSLANWLDKYYSSLKYPKPQAIEPLNHIDRLKIQFSQLPDSVIQGLYGQPKDILHCLNENWQQFRVWANGYKWVVAELPMKARAFMSGWDFNKQDKRI